MTLEVRPDPTQPGGGHALLLISGQNLGEHATLAIREPRKDQWLSRNGWQSDPGEGRPIPSGDSR